MAQCAAPVAPYAIFCADNSEALHWIGGPRMNPGLLFWPRRSTGFRHWVQTRWLPIWTHRA